MRTSPESIASRRRSVAARRADAEVEAAIGMIVSGAARSVRLAGLPGASRQAPLAIVRARRAGIRCRIERGVEGSVVLHFDADDGR